MDRGIGRTAFIIGIEPGSTEIKSAEAFTGPAGKKLMNWLARAGLGDNRTEVLKQCYLTSLTKCFIINKSKSYSKAAKQNCFPFLEEQLKLVNPILVLTLGVEPLNLIFNTSYSLNDVIGRSFTEAELTQGSSLYALLPLNCRVVPFPHPSPLSRWLNSDENCIKLDQAINEIQKLI